MLFSIGTEPFKKLIRSALFDFEKEFASVKELKEKIKSLKEELGDVKLEKRMEEEELKHLVKMKEEKQFVEAKKKELELQEKFNKKEMELLKGHHEKIILSIESQRKESKELYTAIAERLPNVNWNIGEK